MPTDLARASANPRFGTPAAHFAAPGEPPPLGSLVTLRPATPADLAAVRALLASAGLPLDGIEEQFVDGFVVAESDGVVVGAEGVELYGQDGLLRSAVVDDTWRGRGVGDALTRDRLAWARARGLRSVWLLTTTAADYFPRHGFEPVSRDVAPAAVRASREFASVCPSSATAMRLTLDRGPGAPSL
jgi:amino-acid N-acetyltransferase